MKVATAGAAVIGGGAVACSMLERRDRRAVNRDPEGEELARVPQGQVTTYAELAGRAGRPRAARAVGMVMNRNPIPIVLPCHRVVGSTGNLVGYAGGVERKRALLELEGAVDA